ncbi:MAG TPA: L-histidine N(alpha)-methyltransferase [Candidatus Saccharimonadales bacterium]
MKYYKNTELARLYKVSEKAVRNWVEAAAGGRLDLRLHEENGKRYIANSTKNHEIVEELVSRGRKYKNTRGHKIVEPSARFYEVYDAKQTIDIITNLDVYREIPLQYSYFNSGAKRWDTYTRKLLKEDASNALSNTIGLLDTNTPYLDQLTEGYADVNIVDIGVGNALPVRNLIGHFRDRGMLKRYIGIDISPEMLAIAEKNIRKWYNGKVRVEMYTRDIVNDRFDDLLVADSFDEARGGTVNIVLFAGGTLPNFRQPARALSTIHDSLGKNDLLLYTKKLDNPKSRRFFEVSAPGNQEIDLVLGLLNIDKSLYSLEQFFDETKRAREVYAKLNVAVSIEFELDGHKRLVELNKDDNILLWRARHQHFVEIIDQFDRADFDLMQATRSKDTTYALTISRIKGRY